MKKSVKKFISIVLCAIMMFAMGAIASSAATYANPAFELVVVSESSSQVTVSLNLVSGKFNCADFTFVAKSGYTCKSITQSSSVGAANGMFVANVANGKVSGAFMNLYSTKGSFYTATFSKSGSTSFKSGDITVNFSNCSILEKGETIVLSPTVAYPSSVTLSDTEVAMNYKDSKTLTYTANAPSNAIVTWTSSDEDVVTVDENGKVYAAGTGNATVTCTVTTPAGVVIGEASCDFDVSYSVVQWIIIIVLFGFLWYI
ncbi:MAG: Ig-like domain-containing protein [Clostridia bacterium]|nr:Ig-like domain-containing protein [Clostridia bacterium]